MEAPLTYSNEIKREDFQLVGQVNTDRIDQTLGGQSKSYVVEVLRRFFKNKWASIFLFLFVLIIIMAIYVPISSPFSPFVPVANSQFVYNLPSNAFNRDVTVTLRVTNNIYDMLSKLQKGIPDLIINGDTIHNGLYTFVTIRPYLLPELTNLNLVLGTDAYGSDVWTDLWASVAASLLVAFITSIISMIIGVIYGAIAGINAGKNIDTVMMRIVEVVLGAPTILWIMILSIVFSTASHSEGIINKQTSNVGLILAMICISWAQPAVATRTYVLKVKNNDYIHACKTFGGNKMWIIFHHMLPVILGRILVIFVNLIPTIIFYEASLTFLNLKSASDVSLGNMLNNAWKNINQLNLMLPPVIVFSVFTISAQIIANSLNDAIDPRIIGR